MEDQSIRDGMAMDEGRQTHSTPVAPHHIGQEQDHAVELVVVSSKRRRHRGAQRKSTVGNWTPEEDAKLEEAVREFHGRNWKLIASKLEDRKDVECLHRWQKVLDPSIYKGPWTKEENDLIVALVERHGQKNWSLIANSLPGRIGKQCRERWNNYLKPGIVKTPWTEQEDSILVEAHGELGNKWAALSKILPGRSENAIKNHWNCTLSKKVNGGNNLKRRRPTESSNLEGSSSVPRVDQKFDIALDNQTTDSETLDDLPEQPEDENPVEETPPVDRYLYLHDRRLSGDLPSPESVLRSAADSYLNFPSIIRRRTESRVRNSKGPDVKWIKLFGKRLELQLDAADSTDEVPPQL